MLQSLHQASNPRCFWSRLPCPHRPQAVDIAGSAIPDLVDVNVAEVGHPERVRQPPTIGTQAAADVENVTPDEASSSSTFALSTNQCGSVRRHGDGSVRLRDGGLTTCLRKFRP